MSRSQAVELALEQKHQLMTRSTRSYQDNFTSDIASAAEDSAGYVAKVGFKGKDGRTLIGLIDEDCNVGWTER